MLKISFSQKLSLRSLAHTSILDSNLDTFLIYIHVINAFPLGAAVPTSTNSHYRHIQIWVFPSGVAGLKANAYIPNSIWKMANKNNNASFLWFYWNVTGKNVLLFQTGLQMLGWILRSVNLGKVMEGNFHIPSSHLQPSPQWPSESLSGALGNLCGRSGMRWRKLLQ